MSGPCDSRPRPHSRCDRDKSALLLLFPQEKQLADALSVAETWQTRHAQEVKDKSKLEMKVSLLNRYVLLPLWLSAITELVFGSCAVKRSC